MLVSCFITFLPAEPDHIPISFCAEEHKVFFRLQHFFLSTVNFFSFAAAPLAVRARCSCVRLMRGRCWFCSLLVSHRFFLSSSLMWRLFATWRFRVDYDEMLGSFILIMKTKNGNLSYRWRSSYGSQQLWIYGFVCAMEVDVSANFNVFSLPSKEVPSNPMRSSLSYSHVHGNILPWTSSFSHSCV